jgi:PAS domain S-box-containing protein
MGRLQASAASRFAKIPFLDIFVKGTIRTRLLVLFVLLVLLPAIPISVTSAVLGWRRGRQQAITQLELVAKFRDSEIDAWLDDLEQGLHMALVERDTMEFAEFALKRSVLIAEQEEDETPIVISQQVLITLDGRLEQYIEKTRQFEGLTMLNTLGQAVASTGMAQRYKSYANAAYFKQGLEGVYVHLVFSTKKASWVTVAIPIIGPYDEVLGVLVGRADLAPLDAIMVDPTGLGETGETYLVGPDYVALTDSRFSEADREVRTSGTQMALEYRGDASRPREGSRIYRNDRDVAVVGIYRWLPELQVALLAEQRTTEALGGLYVEMAVNIGIAVFAVVLAIGAASFVTRSMARPLTELAEAAGQVAGGDLSRLVHIAREDEIGNLAQSFNAMTVQLRRTISDLEESEARSRAIVEAMPIGMYMYRVDEEDNLIFIGANPAAMQLSSVDTTEYIGMSLAEMSPFLLRTELPRRYREAALEGKAWQNEEIVYQEEGITRVYTVHVFQTSPGEVVAAFMDITARKEAEEERARLQQDIIEAQQQAILELSIPVIPLMQTSDSGGIIVLPLIGSLDTQRARDIMRVLLQGIRAYRASVVILDVTGVPVVDSGVAQHLHKTIQAARLKGARVIVTGISDAVAEAVVDLGIDWHDIETLRDLQSGLLHAMRSLGIRLSN